MIVKPPHVGPLPAEAKRDGFRPPDKPVKVMCLHCGQQYMSNKVYWTDDLQSTFPGGGWVCPTPNCDGAGFGFDILPLPGESSDSKNKEGRQ